MFVNNFTVKPLPKKYFIKDMSDQFNVHVVLCALMLQREIYRAPRFLGENYDELENPFEMKDMDKALNILHWAKDKKVWVFGDYDVDGITSCAIVVTSLKKLGFNVNYMLPDRLNAGYDLNNNAVDIMAEKGCDLLITTDCGSNAFEAVEYAKSKGIKVIVTDHHSITAKSNPDAMINPNQEDCKYVYKKLCGAGVAYKFILAYIKKSNLNEKTFTNSVLEYVTLGTIGDIVPLTDENRILVKLGLKKFENTKKTGFQKLLREAYLFKDITAKNLQYNIIPKLNSASRMGQVYKAYELITETDFAKTETLYNEIVEYNNERLKIEEKMYKEAKEIIEANHYEDHNFLVIYKKEWLHTIVGNIAGKLSKEYNRPVIAIGGKDNLAIGSGRQKNNVDILAIVSKCEDLLIRYGGHKSALGITIDPENIDLFRQKINENFTSKPISDSMECDLQLKIEAIDLELCKELKKMEPYGESNPEPVFLTKNLTIKQISYPGKDKKHTKMVFEKSPGEFIEAIIWNFKDDSLQVGTNVSLAYKLDINNFNFQENPQMIVQGISLV